VRKHFSLTFEDTKGAEIPVKNTAEPISIFIETKNGIPDLKYFKFLPSVAPMNFHPIKVGSNIQQAESVAKHSCLGVQPQLLCAFRIDS